VSVTHSTDDPILRPGCCCCWRGIDSEAVESVTAKSGIYPRVVGQIGGYLSSPDRDGLVTGRGRGSAGLGGVVACDGRPVGGV